MTAHHAALLLVVLLTLAGCSSTPRAPTTATDWERTASALAAHENWALSGKIGVRAPSGNGAATLDWTQHGDAWHLVLGGALGMGRLMLEGTPDGVAWRDTRGNSGRHVDPEALVRELWGWPLPVAALAYWVRGIPQPGVGIEYAEPGDGGLRRFAQSGWEIETTERQEVDGFALPVRVRVTGYGAVLTLAIRRWHLAAP